MLFQRPSDMLFLFSSLQLRPVDTASKGPGCSDLRRLEAEETERYMFTLTSLVSLIP